MSTSNKYINSNEKSNLEFYTRIAFAGAASCSITHGLLTPVDVIKTTKQLYPDIYDKGMIDTGKKIVAKEGKMGLLKGFGPTVIGYFAQGAFKFGGYEFWKTQAINYMGI